MSATLGVSNEIPEKTIGAPVMCGIVGYVGKKSVVPVILDGLRRLEYRGYDSAGIAVAGNADGLQIRRAEGKLRNLEEAIRVHPLDGTYGIGHTRWASTDVPPKRMPTRTATAPARSWSCTTALSKIISV
jgi:asparagine synthetase B (glutamine-hydrolysing)